MEDAFSLKIEKAKKQYDEALKSEQITKVPEMKNFSSFFLGLSEKSLKTANILFDISTDKQKKSYLQLEDTFESYMWAVVSCYYSMFYMACAHCKKGG